MRQLRVDKYHVLNIAPPEYHKMVKNADCQLLIDLLTIGEYNDFRLPTKSEYVAIYNKTNYLTNSYQCWLTSSPITNRIHNFDVESIIGYIDAFYLDYVKSTRMNVYNSVDFIGYRIIPVQLEYKPTLLGKLCNQLQEFAITMIMSY